MIDLKFDRVSKRYLIRNEDEEDAARSPLLRKLKGLWRRPQEFWAVRDVSFEVERGEALGIIGHNGAGKSTILKLLSSITTPSSGEITINGRLAALIEVGSGFHPELTGRENIYLSGSILGMRRSEITRKIESIIDFAGIRQFIDTPVKRYSSGMYVRLGFAIAAHLDPDVLLLDEVLAVGDAAFQSKCLNRVDELRQSGKTIIFISHDLNAVERLCDRALLMDHGQIIASGQPAEVIDRYKNAGDKSGTSAFLGIKALRAWSEMDAPSDGIVRLRKVRVCTSEGETATAIDIRRPVCIEMTYEVLQPGHILVPNYNLFNQERLHLFNIQEVEEQWRRRPRPVGRYVSAAWIPGNFFADGSIVVDANISSHIPVAALHVHQRDAVAFSVIDSFEGDSARGEFTGPIGGVIRPLVSWTTRFQESNASTPLVLEEAETT
jgi:lipopolysaccharide transport system ATP-binding protein